MASVVVGDFESDQEKPKDNRSLNIAEAGNSSEAHSPPLLSDSNQETEKEKEKEKEKEEKEEEDYEQAALAAAEELHEFTELQEIPPVDDDDGSGGFFVEDSSLSLRNDSNGQEDVVSNEEKGVFNDLYPPDGKEKSNRESETHVKDAPQDPLGAVAPPSDRELAELLDDDECADSAAFNSLTRKNECMQIPPNNHPHAAIGSSLLDGTLGLSSRRRAAEAASWCSQHQAADLYCLREQLLKEEAAAGRLRVREQPNPHGEGFKPMRLYAIKEIEELAVKVWGSVEAAKNAKEKKLEERWQRKKKATLLSPHAAKKQQLDKINKNESNNKNEIIKNDQRGVAAVPPIPRTKEDEWEEI